MKITYDDKVSLTTSPLPRTNKCTSEDMNEIKQVINANADLLNVIMPVGSILEYAGETAPTNWLICDGSLISRTTYSDLFKLIGETFGSGDGTSTFSLPDLRQRVPVGRKEDDTDFNNIGQTGGEKTHILTEAEMPSHHHNLYTYGDTGTTSGRKTRGTGNPDGARLTDGGTEYKGGGEAHNNLQPYIVLNYIIKAVKEG